MAKFWLVSGLISLRHLGVFTNHVPCTMAQRHPWQSWHWKAKLRGCYMKFMSKFSGVGSSAA